MFHRSRLLLALALTATATAGYAALRWKPWIPTDACLLCEAPSTDTGGKGLGTPGGSIGTGGTLGLAPHTSTGAFAPGSLGTSPLGSATGSAPMVRLGSAPRGWQPWGTGSGAYRVASGGASGPSAPLGGLWRLMSMSHRGHGDVSVVASNHTETPATHTTSPIKGHPAAPAPSSHTSKPPAAPPAPPSFSGGTTASISAPSLGDAAPAGPTGDSTGSSGGTVSSGSTFHTYEDPPPPPFDGGSGSGGSSGGSGFDPGGGGGLPSSGGGVSATPEPGSLLLIGTGLLGVLGVLRRRRLL